MRKQLVYLIADTSGSMRGEPIKEVWNLYGGIIDVLKHDPFALETVYVSIINYACDVEMTPFREISSFEMPELPHITSGPKNCGQALEKLLESYKNDYVEETPYQKGDWTPIVFLATYGTPSDIAVFNHAVQKIKEINKNGPKLRIYLLHGDERKTEPYNSLTENIHLIKEFDASIVKQIISFVGIEIECEYIHDDSIEFSPERVNNDSTEIPPPPPEVNIVL